MKGLPGQQVNIAGAKDRWMGDGRRPGKLTEARPGLGLNQKFHSFINIPLLRSCLSQLSSKFLISILLLTLQTF